MSPTGKWMQNNAPYAKVWPNIMVTGDPTADADDWNLKVGKFEKYFSPRPAIGS